MAPTLVLVRRTGITRLVTRTTTLVVGPSVTIYMQKDAQGKVKTSWQAAKKMWSATLKPSKENTLLDSENGE